MSVETDQGGIASLAFGDILTAEEPVWVWDLQARRILWANRAGRAFWGADTLENLRQRRFDARNHAIMDMTERAGSDGIAREWTQTLTFPGAAEKGPVRCFMQTMEVAGGRPGLIVRTLSMPMPRNAEMPPEPQTPQIGENPADNAALKHIAARLKSAQIAKRPRPRARPQHQDRAAATASPAAAPSVTAPPAAAAPDPAERPTDHLPPALLRELCHELRNPLTVILGFAERIRDTDPVRAQVKIKAYAENIMEGAHFALEILSDFSNRLRDGAEAPPPPQPADVKAVVASSLRLVAPLAKQAGMSTSKSMGRILPRLRMEERVLKQILLNVLVNAVRHQKIGGRIAVSARMRRDRSLLLAVSDDGIGMTKKEIKMALGAKRGAPGQTANGSGLGLPLVKRLVESAGGAIAIESARRKGTTVAMTFPAGSLVAQSSSEPDPALDGASSAVISL